MQIYLLVAGALLVIIGAIHSILGEVLIFRHLRTNGLVPTVAAPPLKQRHLRIIWATWHALSVLGFGFAAVVFRLSVPSDQPPIDSFVLNAISCCCLGSCLLVLIGTRGKHPGWIGLLAAAILIWMA